MAVANVARIVAEYALPNVKGPLDKVFNYKKYLYD